MSSAQTNADQLTRLSRELTTVTGDARAILAKATSTLSQIRPATWVAAVMEPNPEMSLVTAADDTAHAMAEYVDAYVSALDRPHRTPTIGLSQQVIETGNPIFHPRLPFSQFLTFLSAAGQAFINAKPPPYEVEAVGVLVVPMQAAGSTIGTLGVFDWRQQHPLTEDDVEWVELVAARIALSLEHARLLTTVHRHTERMKLVRGVMLAATLVGDLSLMLKALVEEVRAGLCLDAADILLVPDHDGVFELAASAGFRSAPPLGARIPIDASITSGQQYRSYVEDVSNLERMGPHSRRAQFSREGFQTMLSVPLHARGRLMGVLELFNRRHVEWDTEWLEFFDTLGRLSALVIDDARRPIGAPAHNKLPTGQRPGLSALELEIVRLIADGLTNGEIANRIYRSENTVKSHVRRILDQAGASNRAELASRATREGWL